MPRCVQRRASPPRRSPGRPTAYPRGSTARRCCPAPASRSPRCPTPRRLAQHADQPARRAPGGPRRHQRQRLGERPPRGHLKAYSQGDGASFVSPSRSKPARRSPCAGGSRSPARRRRSPTTSSSPCRTNCATSPGTRPRRSRRGAALPLAPGTATAGAGDHGELAPDLAGRPVLRPLLRAGPERADDLQPSRAGDLVQPGAGRRRLDQPAGAAAERQTGADLLAGLHPAAGLRRGRRGDPQQRLSVVGRVHAGNGLQSRPPRLPHLLPERHRRADGLRADRLQPLPTTVPPTAP